VLPDVPAAWPPVPVSPPPLPPQDGPRNATTPAASSERKRVRQKTILSIFPERGPQIALFAASDEKRLTRAGS